MSLEPDFFEEGLGGDETDVFVGRAGFDLVGFEVAVFAGGAENCLEGTEAAKVNAVVLGKGFGDFGEEEAEEAFGFLAVAEELTGERGGGRVQVHFFFLSFKRSSP